MSVVDKLNRYRHVLFGNIMLGSLKSVCPVDTSPRKRVRAICRFYSETMQGRSVASREAVIPAKPDEK